MQMQAERLLLELTVIAGTMVRMVIVQTVNVILIVNVENILITLLKDGHTFLETMLSDQIAMTNVQEVQYSVKEGYLPNLQPRIREGVEVHYLQNGPGQEELLLVCQSPAASHVVMELNTKMKFVMGMMVVEQAKYVMITAHNV